MSQEDQTPISGSPTTDVPVHESAEHQEQPWSPSEDHYQSLGAIFAVIEAEWDRCRPSDWLDPTKDGSNLRFTFLSHKPGDVPEAGEDEWFCQLVVVAENVPALMRLGFYWTPDLIVPDRGFIIPNDPDLRNNLASPGADWLHTRTYLLRRLQRDSYWLAKLDLHTRDEKLLHTFDPRTITREHTESCVAFDWEKNLVYSFDRSNPDSNVNHVFGHMALRGWWPWPKPDEESICDSFTISTWESPGRESSNGEG
jgi:hypothetical protein